VRRITRRKDRRRELLSNDELLSNHGSPLGEALVEGSTVRQKHLRAARPTENASETPAGRQADGKFTPPSRFALYYLDF